MKKMSKPVFLIFLVGIVLVLFGVALFYGAAAVSWSDFWQSFTHFEAGNQRHQIIRNIRLPRVLGAFVVGSSFALSGALMQGVTKNPLADSGLLGINAGASLAMALCFSFLHTASSFVVFLCSLAGSLLVTLLVFGFLRFSRVGLNPVQLVLAGVAISSFFTAVSQALAQLFNLQQDLAFWFVGGAANITWQQLRLIVPFYAAAVLLSAALGKQISLVNLSEAHALALGGHPQRTRLTAFAIVAVLAAIAVSLVGPVAFIGLMVPHIVRGAVGTDYRFVLPASFLFGGALVVLADFIARMINPPFETPFGLVIALIGVPFLLNQVRRDQL